MDHLPDETLRHILDFLRQTCLNNNPGNVAPVCKRFRALFREGYRCSRRPCQAHQNDVTKAKSFLRFSFMYRIGEVVSIHQSSIVPLEFVLNAIQEENAAKPGFVKVLGFCCRGRGVVVQVPTLFF